SSRRRHTRFSRDWSSDVCSSDLGILARRHLEQDQQHMQQYRIEAFDMVVVDLYPFEETLGSGASQEEVIEKIDIGGISLIRAARSEERRVGKEWRGRWAARAAQH